jgi:hypothetical protein
MRSDIFVEKQFFAFRNKEYLRSCGGCYFCEVGFAASFCFINGFNL